MTVQAGPKERPAIFGEASVRAILKDEHPKCQTRRVMTKAIDKAGLLADAVYPAAEAGWLAWWGQMPPGEELAAFTKQQYRTGFPCPYGKPGDRLWVRESFFEADEYDHERDRWKVYYRATDAGEFEPEAGCRWQSPLFLPRRLARLVLEIVDIRVERLQSISYDDCCREMGAALAWPGPGPEPYHRQMHNAFATHWDSLNGGKRGFGWATNPFVWCISFRRLEPQ